MDSLIGQELMGGLAVLLGLTLGLAMNAKLHRGGASVTKSASRLQSRERHAPQAPFISRTYGACSPSGAKAMISEEPAEGCMRGRRAPRHGKECAPC